MSGFQAAFESIPPVTRFILAATGLVTTPCLLAFIHPAEVALLWSKVKKSYEIWRPLTAFFYGGGGFPLLYDVFLIYRNSSSLERDVFFNNTAEYAWMHVVLGVFILLFNILLNLPFLFRPLLHAQTYIWCRSNPTMKVSLFGLLTIPTSLYPPALIVLDLVTGGPDKALGGLMGLVSGHLWWFLSTYLPLQAPTHLRRKNPLSTPVWFKRQFAGAASTNAAGFNGPISTSWGTMQAPRAAAGGSGRGTGGAGRTAGGGSGGGAGGAAADSSGRAASTSAMRDAAESRHRWGSGQKLGGDPL